MAIILDADVIVRGERRRFDLRKWVASRPNERFEVAAITVAELWHGVERATETHRTSREQYLKDILDQGITGNRTESVEFPRRFPPGQ